jgi:predicted Fe-Mo cluster-binding NifX family protein/NAD-dependent dihydropyrimidine dehydrogenase PreA subunit
MKIAVTASGRTLDDQIDPRFGRCSYFLIVDTETMETEAIENPNVALGGGAGIQSAQLMAQHDVRVVLTGNCGPNAYQTLNAAGIEVAVGASGRIRDAVEQFKSGAVSSTEGPNVASHFGMGGGGGGGGGGMGRGMGGGGGGGMGRGMGGGGGRGMGRGMGGGGGRGMGRGMGGGVGMSPAGAYPASPAAGSELENLKAEAQNLEAQIEAVRARISQIQSGGAQGGLKASVDAEKCTGCRLCEEVCPAGAVKVDRIAYIDVRKCTGCGQCVAECPQEALVLKKA